MKISTSSLGDLNAGISNYYLLNNDPAKNPYTVSAVSTNDIFNSTKDTLTLSEEAKKMAASQIDYQVSPSDSTVQQLLSDLGSSSTTLSAGTQTKLISESIYQKLNTMPSMLALTIKNGSLNADSSSQGNVDDIANSLLSGIDTVSSVGASTDSDSDSSLFDGLSAESTLDLSSINNTDNTVNSNAANLLASMLKSAYQSSNKLDIGSIDTVI